MTGKRWTSGSRFSRRQAIRGASMATAGGALWLAGCGDEEEAPGSAATQGAPGSTATQQPSETADPNAAQYGGVLRTVSRGDPASFDVHQSTSYQEACTIPPLFNNLVGVTPGVAGSIQPELAASWEADADGTIVFTLADGIKWHDGTEFTAEDVVWTFDRMMNPPEGVRAQRQDWFESITGMEAPDAKTVRMTQSYPRASLLDHFAVQYLAMFPRHAIDTIETAPVGTGPYRLASYDVGVSLAYEKNPDYFKADQPYMDGINIVIARDERTWMEAFQAGQLDAILPMVRPTSALALELGSNLPAGAEHIQYDGYSARVLSFNLQADPFTDARVRRAIHLILDRPEAIETLEEGNGAIGSYMTPSSAFNLGSDTVSDWPAYRANKDEDRNEAQSLLDAAGITADSAVRARLLTRAGLYDTHVAWTASQLEPFGFAMELNAVDPGIETGIMDDGGYEMRFNGNSLSIADPDNIARYHITGGSNGYANATLDEMFANQSRETDPEARQELFSEIVALLEEEVPQAMIYWTNNHVFMQESFKNYRVGPGQYSNNRYETEWLGA